MDVNEVLNIAVKACDEKKAENIVVLDMEGISIIADYFVICHGNSEKQVEAIAKEIKDQMFKRGFEMKRMEGIEEARWVLIDLQNVIVHVFHRDERYYYNLEKLWGDARQLEVDEVLNS